VAGLPLVAARLSVTSASSDVIPAVRRADYFGADGKELIPGWSARAHELHQSAARRKRRRPVLHQLRLFALTAIQCASLMTSIPSLTLVAVVACARQSRLDRPTPPSLYQTVLVHSVAAIDVFTSDPITA
jgi:hypothetical protein